MKAGKHNIFTISKPRNLMSQKFALQNIHIDRIASSLVVFLSCFVLSFVAGSFIIQPQGSKAATGLGLVSTPTMTLSADSPAKTLNPNPTANNGLSSGSSTLTASTNVPTGYNLSLSATSAGSELAPTSGTITSPTALTNNTWGYALTKTGNNGAIGVTTGFDTTYTTPTPSTTSKWANPTTTTTIKNTTDSTTSLPASASTTVYYGAKADITLPSGTYTSTVTYTATANITTIPTPSIISVSPSSGSTAGGTSIQIVGTGFTVNDQSVTTAVTIDNQACQNPSISSNTPATGQDTITCTTPAHAAATVDVKVTTWKSTATKTDGYTYKLPAIPMQEITQETCPNTRALAYDARDNSTYWVQKLADGRCWMLTNLAYAGDGTNTYGDVKSITNSNAYNYTVPYYMIPTGSNRTTGTTDPSTSTDGTGQYGYLYNWCAAMGAQTGTDACSNTDTTDANASISICPGGWRLPTGNSGEYQALNNAVNSGSTSSPSGLLSTWLGQYSGVWNNGFGDQGNAGYYWSSTQDNASNAYIQSFGATYVNPGTYRNNKNLGLSVRCILDIPVMQEMTIDECTNRRTVTYDARDNRTYYVQKMADGKCWMLTNLAYGGSGTNTYGDAKTITEGSGGSTTYTEAHYYTPTGANPTDYPTTPSNSTNGGATNPQYGYLYNWCAAMGIQTGTSACANATTPTQNTSMSICPSGWRLPTSNTGGEYQSLTDAIGATTNGSNGGTAGSTALLSTWLGMYSGNWNNGFSSQGSNVDYWSSTQIGATNAYNLYFSSSGVDPSYRSNKSSGYAVRCVMADPVAKTGDNIQTVNIQNCPTTRTRVVDARDNASYWIQKMDDGKCWMLTNLAYGGGGTNTYGDVKSITNSNTLDYANPYYMIPSGSNRTTGTTNPSTSTSGTGQYGYLYNWCAAMGVQTSTSACANATTPAPNTSISICPSGWRLPTGNTGGEYQALNDAINGGSTSSPSGLLSTWLGMYSGRWLNDFRDHGSYGDYWSSTQNNASFVYFFIYNSSSLVYPGTGSDAYKQGGYAVRCIAM